ncbi:MAG: FtsX-like permease family protein [Cytophagales bacterium]|nr:FtsX-like permease family protein [Cytophagales bacterium]
MIVSFAILEGFEYNIQRKIFSFDAHVQITKYDLNESFEEYPITINSQLYRTALSIPGVNHIQPFATKAGLFKTDEEVLGVVLKGVSNTFALTDFAQNIKKGRFVQFNDSLPSNEIVISQRCANKLKLDIDSTINMFFIQNPPRARKFRISGIYETGMEEFDNVYVLGDIRNIQKLNSWPDSMVGGYEIFLKDFRNLDEASEVIIQTMDYDMGLEKITDKYIQLFDWLSLLNRNVYLFLGLIVFVACFNIVSTLLVMIMERVSMIGMLKSMGANNGQVRNIFFYTGGFIIARGLFWGNLIGIGFCTVQYFFKIIPLDAANYYIDYVPIFWNPVMILILNFVLFAVLVIAVAIPTFVISRFKPIQSIKFN